MWRRAAIRRAGQRIKENKNGQGYLHTKIHFSILIEVFPGRASIKKSVKAVFKGRILPYALY